MNQDWREKRIRQLFRELVREDERKAPVFASVLQAALAQGPGRRLRIWRFAAVAALPVLAVVVGLLLLASHSGEPAAPGDFTTLQTIPLPGPDLPPDRPIVPEPYVQRPQIYLGAGRRRRDSPTRHSTLLISQWRSPTDYLLKVPGNELLKSLPRVPDSSPGIRSLMEKQN